MTKITIMVNLSKFQFLLNYYIRVFNYLIRITMQFHIKMKYIMLILDFGIVPNKRKILLKIGTT